MHSVLYKRLLLVTHAIENLILCDLIIIVLYVLDIRGLVVYIHKINIKSETKKCKWVRSLLVLATRAAVQGAEESAMQSVF